MKTDVDMRVRGVSENERGDGRTTVAITRTQRNKSSMTYATV